MTKHKKMTKEEQKANLIAGSQMYNIKPDYTLLILAAIIAIGATFRIYHLDYNPIWLDEAVTYVHSSGTIQNVWTSMTSTTDYSPPLFFVFEWVIIKIFGNSEWWLRFFPAVFGVATIPAMYFVGKEFYDEYAGLVAAGFIAFSPFLIFYSQEARPYSLLLFLCAVLMYFFLKGLKENTINNWIGFSVVAAMLFYTHFYGSVFIAILAGFAIIKHRNSIENLLLSGILWVVLILPLLIAEYFLFIQRLSTPVTYGMQGFPLITGIITQMTTFVDAPYISLVPILLFILGTVWLYYKDQEKVALLIWITGLTILISLVMATRIPMLPRYMIFLTIPLSLGISAVYEPLVRMQQKRDKHITVVAVLVLVFAISGILFYQSYYSTTFKEDWRGISKDLTTYTKNGDVVVIVPRYASFALDFYYSSETDKTTKIGVMSAEELMQVSNTWNKNQSVYYVITSDVNAADPSGELLQLIQQNTAIVKQYGTILIARG